jgi:hypothetical protein
MSMNLDRIPKLDRYGVADKIIPFVPTIALAYLALAGLVAVFGFLGSLFAFSLLGMIGALAGFLMAAVGYAAIMMLHRIYVRTVGGQGG